LTAGPHFLLQPVLGCSQSDCNPPIIVPHTLTSFTSVSLSFIFFCFSVEISPPHPRCRFPLYGTPDRSPCWELFFCPRRGQGSFPGYLLPLREWAVQYLFHFAFFVPFISHVLTVPYFNPGVLRPACRRQRLQGTLVPFAVILFKVFSPIW